MYLWLAHLPLPVKRLTHGALFWHGLESDACAHAVCSATCVCIY